METPFPLWGQSPAILETRERLAKAGATEWPVLIVGESGTGKQSAAEWVLSHSPRKHRRWVEANTACWNGNTMVHSILFGHERGAFTGAAQRQVGLFERAHGGTLFLDEIGDLDLGVQPLLLKALDQGLIEPLGAKTAKHIDTRLIAATNRDLEKEAQEGIFRRDLLARIGTLRVRMPALRERIADLPDLWRGLCQRRGLSVPFPEECVDHIEERGLADNLRGLERLAVGLSVWGRLVWD